jgi:hypothetical protein
VTTEAAIHDADKCVSDPPREKLVEFCFLRALDFPMSGFIHVSSVPEIVHRTLTSKGPGQSRKSDIKGEPRKAG